MSSQKDLELKKTRRQRRKRNIRRKVFGSADRPRLTVFRSHKNIYCQLIDDYAGVTLASASTRQKDVQKDIAGSSGNSSSAAVVGKHIAGKAKDLGITGVKFDRNGYRFHGRVKALAEAAREAGLKM